MQCALDAGAIINSAPRTLNLHQTQPKMEKVANILNFSFFSLHFYLSGLASRTPARLRGCSPSRNKANSLP